MIIAIDFDGTIVEHEFPKIGALKPGVKDFMQRLNREGHQIIIWTCRTTQNDFPEDEPTIFHVEKFLRANDIPFDTINHSISGHSFIPSPKVYAHVYIDDRNVGGLPMKAGLVDWEGIYELIMSRSVLAWTIDFNRAIKAGDVEMDSILRKNDGIEVEVTSEDMVKILLDRGAINTFQATGMMAMDEMGRIQALRSFQLKFK